MVEIAKGVYWAGYIDWDLRNFHGYSTPFGSTYNAYLILDEFPTLIDTVKYYGFKEMLRRIREVIEPSRIRYIISNHTEMDHSGSIGKLLEFCPNAEIVCSPKGKEGLKRHFKKDWKFKIAETLDSLTIGKRTLKFFLTPMVHWPDSMATYSTNDNILFSNDAFGQHYASYERFADEVGADIIFREAAKYYANIIMPYANQVQKVLGVLGSLNLDMICSSHGLIWRNKKDIGNILHLYDKWSRHESENRVVIVYDTMWHSTEKMAIRLYELIDTYGIPVKLMNLGTSQISDIVTEIMFSKFLCVGSPILNNRMLPAIAAFLMYLKGLKPKNKTGFVFGSYGWSTVGFEELKQFLKDAGISVAGDGAYFNYVPEDSELNKLEWIAREIKRMRS